MYKSFVRPYLEYCSPAWSPHYKNYKVLLERVHHRWMFSHLRQWITPLSWIYWVYGPWKSIETELFDLTKVFKIMIGFTSIYVDSFVELSEDNCTEGHTLKLAKHRTDKDLRHYFFNERVVSRWN